ncbi:hypothetical protein M231_05814 [Tremella mesenterica]|uniref:Uncharacterized protein n=1 Tax=Tremella mesenterica TaxID=5217 RepID=A0A4Q1BH49_TREME|nr:hypothetical protein M231_05814 [Tremella mesenterica]
MVKKSSTVGPVSTHEHTLHNARDKASLNRRVQDDFRSAVGRLEQAWGKGGSQGEKGIKQYDKWFRQLTSRILDLYAEDNLENSTQTISLECCAAILSLDIPHWSEGHVEDIVSIRAILRPDQIWEDVSFSTSMFLSFIT